MKTPYVFLILFVFWWVHNMGWWSKWQTKPMYTNVIFDDLLVIVGWCKMMYCHGLCINLVVLQQHCTSDKSWNILSRSLSKTDQVPVFLVQEPEWLGPPESLCHQSPLGCVPHRAVGSRRQSARSPESFAAALALRCPWANGFKRWV